MLKAEQIPPDAMYAAWKAMNAGMTLNDAIAAALNAWPGMKCAAAMQMYGYCPDMPARIILPLTENTNAEG